MTNSPESQQPGADTAAPAEQAETAPDAAAANQAPGPAPTRSRPDPPPPALATEGRGLPGQTVPDVATGSTPLTRRDD